MKNIPLNIRITSIGPRIPGGVETVLVEGSNHEGSPVFQFAINRGTLAEALAVSARQGTALPAELRFIDQGEPETVEVEKPNAVYI